MANKAVVIVLVGAVGVEHVNFSTLHSKLNFVYDTALNLPAFNCSSGGYYIYSNSIHLLTPRKMERVKNRPPGPSLTFLKYFGSALTIWILSLVGKSCSYTVGGGGGEKK